MATLAAGDLDRLVVIKRAPIVDDGFSRNRGVPAEIGRRYAKKDDVADGERLRAGQQAQDLTTRFLMRWDSLTITIKLGDVLECEGESFEVTGNKEARGYDRRSTREIAAAARPDL
ncbi:head-tail adaptor protein [Rhizorhabdus wittichii]|uniref:Head-tail adaptor protein n=1 Tax=Rhizorhabdus wittichii TaxID=160791 RepID=A0A975D3I1_9SPHN|nr:head-tail adaptor protein [Rhizorhabdus wittichii]QTH21994.1 head-tail adaptor protein [Rhizorhabdus wittichii]